MSSLMSAIASLVGRRQSLSPDEAQKTLDESATTSISSSSPSGRGSPATASTGGETIPFFDKFGSFEIEPGVRCCSLVPTGEFVATPPNALYVKTLWDAFKRGLSISPKGRCLGWRSGPIYEWWTYEDVDKKVKQLCNAFKTKTNLTRQDCVAIYAHSVPQWAVCSLAIHARSMCVVPLYDSLGPDSCTYIINQTEASAIIVDTPSAVNRIVDLAEQMPTLKTIICFSHEVTAEMLEKANEKSICLVTLDELMFGEVEPDSEASVYDEPKDGDIAVVQYTSGTTGLPKGAVITHRAFLANFVSFDYFFSTKLDPIFALTPDDICMLFLPMAHMYGQLVCYWFMLNGAAIGFYGGNVLKIVEDAAILKPSFMPLVPRIMNRVYTKIKSQVGTTGLKAKLFWYCYEKKKEFVKRGILTRTSVWDYIAFRRIQQLLGGNIRFISVGSAPISAEVLEFWRVVFGCLVIEGYGQTECGVIATMAMGPTGGNVGHPLVCNHIKLADVDECGYYAKDGKGEVCIKGANVMSGYYKQHDKTAEAFDRDGWLHTGDIGEFLPDGSLRIIDRKKHIFKLAQGEYIAPEKVENVYLLCPLISQVFVDGSSMEPFTVAIVVPDPEAMKSWALSNNVDPETVTKNADFVKFIYDKMISTGKENKLNSLEQVRNIYLTGDAFSVANGLLTPSMKNKRAPLRQFFKEQIADMYKAGPLVGEADNKAKETSTTQRDKQQQ